MAEHDDLVRQAAEAVIRRFNLGYHVSHVEEVLAPVIAAARKEAVEQALRRERELDEKTNRAIERRIRKEAREGAFLEAGNACIGASLDGTRANDERPGLRAAAGVIAALRSKPKEPA